MSLQKFMFLLSVLMGLVGSLFLVKAILSLSPRNILLLTPPYSRACCSSELITSISQQKAESLVGILFVVFSFLLQLAGAFME